MTIQTNSVLKYVISSSLLIIFFLIGYFCTREYRSKLVPDNNEPHCSGIDDSFYGDLEAEHIKRSAKSIDRDMSMRSASEAAQHAPDHHVSSERDRGAASASAREIEQYTAAAPIDAPWENIEVADYGTYFQNKLDALDDQSDQLEYVKAVTFHDKFNQIFRDQHPSACLNREMVGNDGGRTYDVHLAMQIEVGPDSSMIVKSANVVRASIPNAALDRCLAELYAGVRIPAQEGDELQAGRYHLINQIRMVR